MSHLCTAVGGQQFRKERRKLQTRIMFELYFPFFHNCLLHYRYVMFHKRFLSKPKWGGGAQGVVGEGYGSPGTRNDGTDKNCRFVLYFYTRTIKAPF